MVGRSNAISTSKIKKITAIRKNRNEKGNRAEFLGSNPHSKGDLFSRSSIIFFENVEAIIIIAVDSIMINNVVIIMIIIYLVSQTF